MDCQTCFGSRIASYHQEKVRPDKEMPPPYQMRSAFHITCFVLTVLAFVILFNFDRLPALRQDLLSLFKNIKWLSFGIGIGVTVLFSAGAFLLIREVKKGKGSFYGEKHWVPIVLKKEDYKKVGYLDTSTQVDEKGIALVYQNKHCVHHSWVSLGVFAFKPLEIVLTMGYHLLRTLIVPFYILYHIARKTEFKGEGQFKWKDISRQMKYSLRVVVMSPFYGLACMYAALYQKIDWLNGGKLLSLLEREWAGDVPLCQGFWITIPAPGFKWEGGGSPEKLGRNGSYMAGCWQPIAVVKDRKSASTWGYDQTGGKYGVSFRSIILQTDSGYIAHGHPSLLTDANVT